MSGRQSGSLDQNVFQQRTAANIIIQVVMDKFFRNFNKLIFKRKGVFQVNAFGKYPVLFKEFHFQDAIRAKSH